MKRRQRKLTTRERELLGHVREARARQMPLLQYCRAKGLAARETATTAAVCRLQSKGWVIECASLPPAEWLAGLMAADADAVP